MSKVKLKSNRGAAKRFKKTGTGRYKHRQRDRNHILTKKSTKRKRHLRAPRIVAKADTAAIDRMIEGC